MRLITGSMSLRILRRTYFRLVRERFKGPRNTAGLRSSFGRSTFHCINTNSRPDCLEAPG
jgi:hypothetical protein